MRALPERERERESKEKYFPPDNSPCSHHMKNTKGKKKYFFSSRASCVHLASILRPSCVHLASSCVHLASTAPASLGEREGEKKKFPLVFFLWLEQVELSGQKVSGNEIYCSLKKKNIFFLFPTTMPSGLASNGSKTIGSHWGRIKKIFLRRSYIEAQI